MPLDHYITLGRSGLRVSPLCLGTMTFGPDWGWGADEQDSVAILDRFLERGGNFIDTANVYTKGHAERIIGDHIGRHPARRDRVVIATKFAGNLYPGDPNGGGAHRKALLAQCEESLRRLQTDYIDLYWMHCWDETTPIEETLRALDDLVHAGKVRYIGLSDTPAWKCAQAQTIASFRGWTPVVALQLEYSLLERSVEGELLPMSRELGLGVVPWSPLKSGVLSGKYAREQHGRHEPARGPWVMSALDERTYALLDELAKIANSVGSSVARVALSWVIHRKEVCSTSIGARTTAQLDDNLAALDLQLGPEHTRALDALTKPRLDFPAEFLPSTRPFVQGGTTIDARPSDPWRLAPRSDAERY